MNATPKIRDQLQTLVIPKEQRPAARRGARASSRLAGGLIALLIIAGLAYAGYRYWPQVQGAAAALQPPATEVRALTVSLQRSSPQGPVLTATGKIVSDHRVQIVTKVSGQIVALFFEQGDAVKSGQTLARIEDVLYRARRDQAAAELEKSRASLAYQQVNFNRVKSLHDQGTGSDIEFADAKRAYDEAQAQVQADTAALAWAEKALIDTQVLAPISGVVLERNVEVGDFVAAEGGRGANANAQFASIADMTKLRVEIDISELDIGRVHAGQPCIITPDAYKDRRYDGRVMWIDPGANYAKATVQVKVRIEQPDDFLRVEGSAKVEFLADKPAAVASDDASPRIWIPAVACQVQPDSRTARVFIIDDGRLRETTIQIGRQTGGQVEVVSGLSEGQSIASDGLDKLRDGQRVKS